MRKKYFSIFCFLNIYKNYHGLKLIVKSFVKHSLTVIFQHPVSITAWIPMQSKSISSHRRLSWWSKMERKKNYACFAMWASYPAGP